MSNLTSEKSTPKLVRSFIGHLEGTQKSLNTVKNYQTDLATFMRFLETEMGSHLSIDLAKISMKDLENYSEYLITLGLQSNTRRRRLLTLRKFLRYLSQRKKVHAEFTQKLPAPAKNERVPSVISLSDLIEKIKVLPQDTLSLSRDRLLIWLLAETGLNVTEVVKLRASQFFEPSAGASMPSGAMVSPAQVVAATTAANTAATPIATSSIPTATLPTVVINEATGRIVPISYDLYLAVKKYRADLEKMIQMNASGQPTAEPYLFSAVLKTSLALESPLTPRAVELIVKANRPKLGFDDLTPRKIRHSTVLYWHLQGCPQNEIQKRLGLRTSYAFRTYSKLFAGYAAGQLDMSPIKAPGATQMTGETAVPSNVQVLNQAEPNSTHMH